METGHIAKISIIVRMIKSTSGGKGGGRSGGRDGIRWTDNISLYKPQIISFIIIANPFRNLSSAPFA